MQRTHIIATLESIRYIALRAAAASVACSLVTFIFATDILKFLQRSSGLKVYYFSLPEAFFARLDLSLFGGIFLSWPVIAYLFWHRAHKVFASGVSPGYGILVFSIFLFYAGSLFCFKFVLPSGIQFLISYGGGTIKPMISIHHFVFFAVSMIFAFGAAFEIPIVMIMLSKFGILTSRLLSRTRKYALLAIVAAAALITPTPDIYNMALLAVPMYILYESGILLVRIRERRSHARPANTGNAG